MKPLYTLFTGALFGLLALHASADLLRDKKFSVTFNNTDLQDALKLIAHQADLELEITGTLTGKSTKRFTEATLSEALKTLAADHKLTVEVDEGILYIEQVASTSPRGPAQARGTSVFSYQLRHTDVKEIAGKLPALTKPDEKIIVDEANNTLVFYGSERSYADIRRLIDALDRMPEQIVLEAHIVETSKNFGRDIGFRWGETSANPDVTDHGKATGYIKTPMPDPNFFGKFLLGKVNGMNLEAILSAAESQGTAKIISRPKVIVLNNQPATIHSGVTFSVKTLTTATEGGGAAVTGGIQSIAAGLQLQVQPMIMGKDYVRLKVMVNNSEADLGSSVDGIPAIIDNSANTSIIIRNGQTATLAGLIKSSTSKSSDGVPILSSLPLIGALFKSHSRRERDTEMMIFITPRILRNPDELAGLYSDKQRAMTTSEREAKADAERAPASLPAKN